MLGSAPGNRTAGAAVFEPCINCFVGNPPGLGRLEQSAKVDRVDARFTKRCRAEQSSGCLHYEKDFTCRASQVDLTTNVHGR